MRILRTVFWAIIGLCLIVIGLANRGFVTLRVLPEALGDLVGVSPDIELPLYMVILFGVAIGLLVGFVWEWLREHKHRAEARMRAREVGRLEREVDRLKTEKHEGEDDVLALLDTAPARR